MYTRNTKDLVYLLALAIVRFTATHERQLPTSIGVNEEKNAFGNKIAVLHTQSVRTIACTYAVRQEFVCAFTTVLCRLSSPECLWRSHNVIVVVWLHWHRVTCQQALPLDAVAAACDDSRTMAGLVRVTRHRLLC